jgi:hypothetical protein
VRLQFFEVEDGESVTLEQPLDRQQREIGIVLVIDRVEVIRFDHAEQMRKLQRDHAVIGEQDFQARRKIVDVRQMGKHVVACENVGANALAAQCRRSLNTKETDAGGNTALFLCHRRDVRCRVDAQHRNTAFLEVLEQITVVASNLDDARIGVQAEALDHHAGIGFGVTQPGLGIRREVGVGVVEQFIGGAEILQLHQAAFAAHEGTQGIEFFRPICLIGTAHRVRNGRHAEIDKRLGQWR